MTVDLYLTPVSPPCRAVLMTAKYVGIDTNQKIVDVMAKDQLKPEYIKMNPQHTVPTLDDNGFILWESRAIQTYLANKFAPDSSIYPKDPQARAAVDRLLYFDIGTLFQAEFAYVFPQLAKGEPADSEKEEKFKTALGYLEGFLRNTTYAAANHITLADLALIASLTFAEAIDYSYESYPKISAWMQKLKSEIPNYKEINDDPINQLKEYLKSKE